MKKYINLMLVFAGFALIIGCGSKNDKGGTTPSGSNGACATIPAGAALSGPSCITTSGKWNSYYVTESSSSKSYMMYCNAEEYEHDPSQADFDANEGTSTSPSVKVKSNEDYVKTATCASGSVYSDNGSSNDKLTFIWTKQP